MTKNRPCSVIETPRLIQFHLERCEHSLNATRKLWVAGGWVLNLKQLLREPAEVVNGSRRGIHRDACSRNIPMRRYGKDRPRHGQPLADTSPCGRVCIVAHGIHGITMTDEQCRQCRRHFHCPIPSCCRNDVLSQERNSSSITPFFQCGKMHMMGLNDLRVGEVGVSIATSMGLVNVPSTTPTTLVHHPEAIFTARSVTRVPGI